MFGSWGRSWRSEDLLLWSLTLILVGFELSLASTTVAVTKTPDTDHRKACLGAVSAVSITHNDSNERYKTYRKQYTNCTNVMGNLVISFLDQADDYDMGFLKDIQEVSGFIRIVGNHFSYLNLTSLRVIRGKTLYSHINSSAGLYGLFLANNYKRGSDTVGLKELGLVSLQEITAGGVYFYNNDMLCFENTIMWKDILLDDHAEVTYQITNPPGKTCNLTCHPKCTYEEDLHCWGEGSTMCQNLSKVTCSKQCDSRCFGLGPKECCHPECAGGCSGPKKTDCFACKNFIDDGVCVEHCPPFHIYKDYKFFPNPNPKYAYGNLCVKECPDHLIADKGACVSECSAGHEARDGQCVPCSGPCPKSCPGTETDYLDSVNINNFTDCTVINGKLKILHNTFKGNPYRNISGITVDQLSVFKNLQEITDYLIIQGSHEGFVNLSFLSNLAVIHGRNLDGVSVGRPLLVVETSLKFLGLRSLKEIRNGRPLFSKNQDLCYISSVNWSRIVKSPNPVKLHANKNETLCENEGKVCFELCTDDGCWGPGDDQCLDCSGYRLGERCVASCDAFDGWFKYENGTTKECRKCHTECLQTCTGEDSDQCDSCKHFKDGPYCVDKCPSFKYLSAQGLCEMCHENCRDGCTGPDNTVGAGACNACAIVVYDGQPLRPVKCLRAESGCGSGFFGRYILSANSSTEKHEACYRCHPECTECTGEDVSFCSLSSCVHYVEGKRCVYNCSSDHYPDHESQRCLPCNRNCLRCSGPTSLDCVSCRDLKFYTNIETREEDPSFTCVEKCPEEAPLKITDTYNGERDSVCVTEVYAEAITGDSKKRVMGIVVGVIVGIVLIGLIVIVLLCIRRQLVRSEENKLRLAARLSGMEECEPLNPSMAGPDMSMLRLIKESELERENIIGSGAFGTVYKGAWKPEKENVKIPVAIKVLQESSPIQNKELLEEARIMASVDHQCCVRILAVCMTAQMMLVTQLMPLGCLLDYVRKNQRNIGSKVLLNWSTQIAKGMNYLEGRGIVHRDLAARNVLVQSPYLVRITDFGLSKLLDYNQDQFQAAGGKMPIKWLALECIQHRIFTHKSDVWSFGVTMWELYTYGQRPYENVVARDIPNLLEKGERLSQPVICTIDVYMIMIKCWMLDAESRPSFHELAEEYAKMARDPGRYLVIEGDKLMKLPEPKYKPKDLLSETDGPEEIISADEYLQPQPLTRGDSKLKGAQTSRSSNPVSTSSSVPKNEARHNGLESAAARKRPKNSTSRYSSDPCKLLSVESSEDHPSPDADSPDGVRQPPSSLDVPVKLPVDEDDYLQPGLSSPSTYLEVIDSDTENAVNAASSPQTQFSSNPEYFENAATQNLSQNSGNQPELQPLKFQNLSSGSEAEYYNAPAGRNFKQPGHLDTRQYNESEV